MKILFDSSALFKRYAGESGTRAVLDPVSYTHLTLPTILRV